MKTILMTLSLMTFATIAQAKIGGVDGGGGRAVVCRDSSGLIEKTELLDLYEARTIFGLELLPSKKIFSEQMDEAIAKLVTGNSGFWLTREYLKSEFSDKIQFIGNDSLLTPIDDSGEAVVPKGCNIEQVANYYLSGRILIKKEIWDRFDPESQAALAIHELSYKAARDWGQPHSSYFVRRFVGLLFSSEQLKSQEDLPKFDITYFCTNSDNHLGTNVLWEIYVGGNRCSDSAPCYQDSQVRLRTIDGQIVYGNASFDSAGANELMGYLDPAIPLIRNSTVSSLTSQVFDGFLIAFDVIEKNGVRVPEISLDDGAAKSFVQLDCTKSIP